MAGGFSAGEVKKMPYNRVVRNLGYLSKNEFIDSLKRNFSEVGSDERVPAQHGDICVYFAGRWRCFRFNGTEQVADPIERLDVSILQSYVLAPILGIEDARTDERLAFVGGKKSVDEIE